MFKKLGAFIEALGDTSAALAHMLTEKGREGEEMDGILEPNMENLYKDRKSVIIDIETHEIVSETSEDED